LIALAGWEMQGLVKEAYLESPLIVEEESKIGWQVEERGGPFRMFSLSLTLMTYL
jgi:hypothetical protein